CSVRNSDRFKPGGGRVGVRIAYSGGNTIELPEIQSRLSLELVDLCVRLIKFGLIAAEDAGHGFVQHSFDVYNLDCVRCRKVAGDIRCGRRSSLLSLSTNC